MTKVDHWGRRSGIVKVIPPKLAPLSLVPCLARPRTSSLTARLSVCREWVAALPPIDPSAIANIKIKHPIQQNMVGITGLFRQQK